jgi:hypothetical protein
MQYRKLGVANSHRRSSARRGRGSSVPMSRPRVSSSIRVSSTPSNLPWAMPRCGVKFLRPALLMESGAARDVQSIERPRRGADHAVRITTTLIDQSRPTSAARM